MAERLPHHSIQAIANRHLVRIGEAPIPEALNVDDNDGPVNGRLGTGAHWAVRRAFSPTTNLTQREAVSRRSPPYWLPGGLV